MPVALLPLPETGKVALHGWSGSEWLPLKVDADGTLVISTTGPPSPHASTHEYGGSDEINVTGLTGLLATPQNPVAHGSTHASGGSDPADCDTLDGFHATNLISKFAQIYISDSWTITAGATTWETDPYGYLSVSVDVTSWLVLVGTVLWSSNNARTLSVDFRFTESSLGVTGYTGYVGEPVANTNVLVQFLMRFQNVAAGSYSVYLQARRNNAGDTVTITHRRITGIVIPVLT